MVNQIKEIGFRLKELRELRGYSVREVSENLGLSMEEYRSYENGEKDFSFSVMYRLAEILEVDIVNILSGHSPKLKGCSVVRKGKGMRVKKDDAYEYKHLAYTFANKKAEPFLVTIHPDDVATMHGHKGQEFNYVLEGTLRFRIGDLSYDLEEGDSVYFDSSIEHMEMSANGETVVFLAVVIKD